MGGSRKMSLASQTLVAVLAAMAAVTVLILTHKGGARNAAKSSGGTASEVSQVSQTSQISTERTLDDECAENARRLIADNYTVVRLFVTEGLPYDKEPNGEAPKDGFFTVNSSEYTDFGQIEHLVRSVYIGSEADRILTRLPIRTEYGDALSEKIAVYAERENSGSGSVLGISERFTPYTNYSKPWDILSFTVSVLDEENCFVTVYLGTEEIADYTKADKANILITKMIKENGEWRLCEMMF